MEIQLPRIMNDLGNNLLL